MRENPYDVPPFSFDPFYGPNVKYKYFWWSWHPCYPKWSKSCWNADSIDEALYLLDSPFVSGLKDYHNKLIREGDGKYVEVYDVPCQRLAVWRHIAKNLPLRNIGDAKPVPDWDK